jgi:hypothetical protein
MKSDCSVSSCTKVVKSKGYCSSHYMKYWKYGDPLVVRPRGRITHGKTNTPEYRSWSNMRQRCYDENNNRFYRYGGRGIKVCDRWLGPDGFVNFLEDMGKKAKGESVDRIDNNGDYTPSNCQWATAKEQSRNKSTNVVYGGRCMREWTEVLDIEYAAFAWRVKKYGWSNALEHNGVV